MMNICKASSFDFECLLPRYAIINCQILSDTRIGEVFGFNLSHWSTQLSKYLKHKSVGATMVGAGTANSEFRLGHARTT